MTAVLLLIAGLLVAVAGGLVIARRRRVETRTAPVHRILLPFTGQAISRRAFDAAIRLAKAEDATLMPAYLAIVPMELPLDSALAKEASGAMPMLEAVEQRATAQGVPVDARVARGRSYRHALFRLLEQESFDRVVVPATAISRVGFSADDLIWLLEEAPAEVVILRPGPQDKRVISSVPATNNRRSELVP
jgi:nucleotide-binding universal stress UspA family protein